LAEELSAYQEGPCCMGLVIKSKWMRWARHAVRSGDVLDLIALTIFCAVEITNFRVVLCTFLFLLFRSCERDKCTVRHIRGGRLDARVMFTRVHMICQNISTNSQTLK
jgi:hypothetical protein